MTIGILGGGQLGYMLALAGYPLGLHFRFLDPSPEAPVGRIANRVTANFNDEQALEKFSHGLRVVTYEFENVPVAAAKFLAKRVPVYPPEIALEEAQDRLREKQLFRRLEIPTTEFCGDCEARRSGRGRKGGWLAGDAENMPDGLRRERTVAAANGRRCGEGTGGNARCSVNTGKICAVHARAFDSRRTRAQRRDSRFYPLIENHHRDGILRLSLAPAPNLTASLQQEAEHAARKVLEELGYAGVLCIEFFEVGGRLLANEMAPRVHNSGHWTIEGAVTSQFENHLRAILGMPLGSTAAVGGFRDDQPDR